MISILSLNILSIDCLAQDDKILASYLLDKSTLSGIGLKKIDLKNDPERDFFQKRLYRGKEISVYVVSSETWEAPFDAFWFDEFILMLHGQASVTVGDKDIKLYAVERIFSPQGFSGSWKVEAGDYHHYELSVITNQRADSSSISPLKAPLVLNEAKLSGAHINLDDHGLYEEILAHGIELDILLHAEAPRDLSLTTPQKEKLIEVLSGQITVKDPSGITNVFYTGDFFVLPHDFVGEWKSEGHGMVKYLAVQKSEQSNPSVLPSINKRF